MGPLDIFIGWQPLLLAAAVYMITQLIKATLDTAIGETRRKGNRVLTRLVLPALPPLLGALLAFAPVHPQSLLDYAANNHLGWWEAQSIFAAWGAMCGQFADYLYSKAKAFAQH